MFDFIKVFPPHYQDCFQKPEMLKQYLAETEFIHAVENLLYQSQIAYFRDEPDHIGDFLLEYRETFLRALGRFELQDVPLESYIGFLLKTYRKNFTKLQQQRNEREDKIYTHCSNDYLERNTVDNYPSSQQEKINSCIAECDSYSEDSNSLDSFEDISKNIFNIANEVMDSENGRAKKHLEFHKILRILLVCNEYEIDTKGLKPLLAKAKIVSQDYSMLLEKREAILADYRAKQNEVKRKIGLSYLNYLAAQRAEKKQQGQHDKTCNEVELQKHREEMQRLSQVLKSLRFRYFRMRCALTFKQMSELSGIAEEELRIYYRKLKKYMQSLQTV